MIHLYKYNGRKRCYDTASGAVFELTALQFKMLGDIQAPMTPACPTSLRYELAKYDSDDVTEAYDELYGFFSDGLLLGEDNGTARLRISGGNAVTAPEEADILFALARSAGAVKYSLTGSSELSELISRLAENNGLTK